MIIYLVCEMNYADFETGLDDNISFCGAYKNKRKAIKKAKELIKNAQKDNLWIIIYQIKKIHLRGTIVWTFITIMKIKIIE